MPLSYLSCCRYAIAGILYHFSGDSSDGFKTVHGSWQATLRSLRLDTFDSAGKNALICLSFYLFYTVGGYLALKYAHLERR